MTICVNCKRMQAISEQENFCSRCINRLAHMNKVPEAMNKSFVVFAPPGRMPFLDPTNKRCISLGYMQGRGIINCDNITINNLDVCPACFFKLSHRITSRL